MSRLHRVRHIVTTSTTAPPAANPNRIDPQTLSPYDLQQRRRVRATALLETIVAVDTTTDPAARHQLIRQLHDSYQARGGGTLLGLFSRCYLGAPYIDHRLSLTADILEHYTGADIPSAEYLPARALARSPHYAFIEVYTDGQVVPIRVDGRAVL